MSRVGWLWDLLILPEHLSQHLQTSLSLTDIKISYASYTPMKSQQAFLQCCCTVFVVHCFSFLSMTEDYIAVSLLSFSSTNSLSWSRIFYQYLCYQSGHFCYEASFCLCYCSPYHCLVVLAGHSDPRLPMLPLNLAPWTPAKAAKCYHSPWWLFRKPTCNLRKGVYPPTQKILLPPLQYHCWFLASYHQLHSSYATIYLT